MCCLLVPPDGHSNIDSNVKVTENINLWKFSFQLFFKCVVGIETASEGNSSVHCATWTNKKFIFSVIPPLRLHPWVILIKPHNVVETMIPRYSMIYFMCCDPVSIFLNCYVAPWFLNVVQALYNLYKTRQPSVYFASLWRAWFHPLTLMLVHWSPP